MSDRPSRGAGSDGKWRVAVVGAGSWGTALALQAHRSGHEVTLWVRREELARQIAEKGENAPYLPGHTLPAALRVTADAGAALASADCVSPPDTCVRPGKACRPTFQPVHISYPRQKVWSTTAAFA